MSSSSATSPSQLSAGSTSHFLHNGHHNGQSSGPYIQPSSHGQSSSSSAFASLASRMRERDADAMEKYLRRNRSESQGTASTADTRSHSGSVSSNVAPSINGDDLLIRSGSVASTPRQLRPSMSASQLRPLPEPQRPLPHTPDVGDSRHPTPGSSKLLSTPNPVQGPVRTSSMNHPTLSPRFPPHAVQNTESEIYTGPPSQYAQFPDPPAYASEDIRTPVATRRMGLTPAPKSNPAVDSLAAPTNHRRGLSATVRGS
jgi:uncharacterized protein